MWFSSDQFTWADVRPLTFALNHYVTIPLFGLSEFAVRLVPALAGVAAIPVFGWAVGRLYGRRAGVFTALAIALSPVLLTHSQFARYYMQSFLFAGFAPFGLRLWMGTEGSLWLWITVLCLVVGWFFVPSSSFIVPGMFLWIAVNLRVIAGRNVIQWMRHYALFVGAAFVVVMGAGSWLIVGVLRYSAEMLQHGRIDTLPHMVAATAAGMTIPMSLAAVGGLVLVSRDRTYARIDRTFLPLLALGSAVTYVAAYPFVAMGAYHVISVLAVAYAAGGVALASIWQSHRIPLAGVVAVCILFLSTLPDVSSYYIDGGRPDYRAAVAELQRLHRVRPGPVYADIHGIVDFYGADLAPHEVTSEWDSVTIQLGSPTRTEPVWLLLGEHRKGVSLFNSVPGSSAVVRSCLLRGRILRNRFDYYVNALRIYECG